MKIGIEVQRLFRKRKFGIELSSLELIKAIRDVEPSFEFVVFVRDDVDRQCLRSSGNLKVATLAGRLFIDFEQVFLPLAARREQIDVLHCTGNTTPYFSPVPIVQTLHDVIFMDRIPFSDTWYQRVGNHYRRRIVPWVTQRSKAVITVSEYEKQRILHRLNIDPDRIHVIYNGLNQKRFHANHSRARQYEVRHQYGLPDRFMLFLGNQAARKNPQRMLEAYARYMAATANPIPLLTPGLSSGFIRDTLQRLQVTIPEHLIIAPGYVADHDLPVLYQLSTVFLFPSLSEGFGMPILEAMASGTPVITSNASAMPEVAGGAAILVDPTRTDELAGRMQQLLEDTNLQGALREKGLNNASRFSWQHSAARVLNLYEAVYAESRALSSVPSFLSRPDRHVFSARHVK